MHNSTLYRLTWLAAALSLGHHLDHLIRHNAVGWPLTGQVNAFTISLVVYPVIATGLLLYRAGRVGSGFWALVSGGGAVTPLLLVSAQLAEASPSRPTPFPHTVTGTEADRLSTLASAWLPEASLELEPLPDGWLVPPLLVCWLVPQVAEASPTALPQTVSGIDGATLPMPAST